MRKEEILNEIRRKSLIEGISRKDLKPLYIELNTFNLSLDCSIYRIFEAPYLIEDIKNSQITLSRIDPRVLDDPYENPLLHHIFIYEHGEKITLKSIMSKYYGQPWTYEEEDYIDAWDDFTHANLGIRVKTDVYKLMDRICNTENEFFSLQYHFGKVHYYQKSDIDKWLKIVDYRNFLDSLGHDTCISLLALRENFKREKEARLTYYYEPDPIRNPFTNKITITDDWCKHPFEWNNIIEGALIDPRANEQQYDSIKNSLLETGVVSAISQSQAS